MSTPRRARTGAVLLEVILAGALLAMGVLIILSGLNSSLRVAQRVQLEAQASDLAVTLLSELQMGLVMPVSDGPNEYEQPELADWTWEIVVEPMAQITQTTPADVPLPTFQQVQVVVRNKSTGYALCFTQLMTEEPLGSPAADDTGGTGGFESSEMPADETGIPADGAESGAGRPGGRRR